MPRLELDIDVSEDEDHVRGTVRAEGDDGAVAFVGWIGLLSLLQQAVS